MTPIAAAHGSVETARRIAEGVAGPAADAVDREARFPHEAIAALREEGLSGAFVPRELGGLGATIGELAAVVRNARAVLRVDGDDLCDAPDRSGVPGAPRALLAIHSPITSRSSPARAGSIASATSEIGVGGDLRRSVCAVECLGSYRVNTKRAPVISYGEEADDILLTARRAPDAAAAIKCSCWCGRPTFASRGPATGMPSACAGRAASASAWKRRARSTRSCPSRLRTSPARTMIPFPTCCGRHCGSAWRATRSSRPRVRPRRSSPHTRHRAARRAAPGRDRRRLGSLRATVREGLAISSASGRPGRARRARVRDPHEQPEDRRSQRWRRRSWLRRSASAASAATGMTRRTRVGRHLRDAHGAPLMISNDRVLSLRTRRCCSYTSDE